MTTHAERVAAINAERAAMPHEQRIKAEAADAPYLRIGMQHALERAERAEANTDPALQQRLAVMEKLAAAWQETAERARKDLAVPADMADVAEMRIWSALTRTLTEEEVTEHLKLLRHARLLSVEAVHIAADTYEDAKKRAVALHHPVTEMGQAWCNECSVQRSTGPRTWERIAYIPHPCPTIRALNGETS